MTMPCYLRDKVIPQEKGTWWWSWCVLFSGLHDFALIEAFVLKVALSLGREGKRLYLIKETVTWSVEMLTPKCWINLCLGSYTLNFPVAQNANVALFWLFSHKLLCRIAVMQNVAGAMFRSNCFSALGGINLVCHLCIFTHVKQLRMKGVMTTRYYHHFMSRMSLLDWNWWMCAKFCA